MIFRVEKQRVVGISLGDTSYNSAMFIRSESLKRDGIGRGNSKKNQNDESINQRCNHLMLMAILGTLV